MGSQCVLPTTTKIFVDHSAVILVITALHIPVVSQK